MFAEVILYLFSFLQQLRYICKTYGVGAFISTANARDSLYRVAVNFVLDYCERYMRHNLHIILIITEKLIFLSHIGNFI